MKKVVMLLENSINSRLCCHCGVCVGVCSTHAIVMEKNTLRIDVGQCVDCGLCVSCCHAGGYELSDLTLEDIKEIQVYGERLSKKVRPVMNVISYKLRIKISGKHQKC